MPPSSLKMNFTKTILDRAVAAPGMKAIDEVCWSLDVEVILGWDFSDFYSIQRFCIPNEKGHVKTCKTLI